MPHHKRLEQTDAVTRLKIDGQISTDAVTRLKLDGQISYYVPKTHTTSLLKLTYERDQHINKE